MSDDVVSSITLLVFLGVQIVVTAVLVWRWEMTD